MFTQRYVRMEGEAKVFPTCLSEVKLPDRLPPIVITAFTRPDLLAPVLEAIALQSLSPQEIIAFVDGARNDKDRALIQQCVDLLKNFERSTWSVRVIQREHNLGCDRNVIAAFTEVFESHDTLVYLEDDDLPNPCFYDRICRLLTAYKDRQDIFSVSGYVSRALPAEEIATDFFPSRRVFSWGFGIWRDRWQSMDLVHQSGQHNPFGHVYSIPTTVESKLTLANQFWLEKNQKTDWVITMTLCALHQGRVHLVPKHSIVKNIGFGHEQSETYRGEEGSWVNKAYDPGFVPETIPVELGLCDRLNQEIGSAELAKFLGKKGIWLTPAALAHYLKKYPSPQHAHLWLGLFLQQLPTLLRRWKSGLQV
ncbi:glycosyltransferase [Oscillatoria sp. CS-180]|uniref:glycosyltransferase n=1 Tax=Oscillatoria sp. CS-180 TaxID=3021720 RepID=UPI00232EFAB5|nr:glycosyltransferase [Oscillatoria sp. CS-180]MDB9524941.1 glycosyltransferase [Oscillatoria sp. CS-180]